MSHEDPIPMVDVVAELEESWEEVHAAVVSVLRSGKFILGPEVHAFEEEAAAYLGCRHAIGVNSGTDALVIALRALGVGAGDEVVTTAFTFFATAEGISAVGAQPVFADVTLDTLNIDPKEVERLLTTRTRAILPVHLFGKAAPLEEIASAADGTPILEDVAQAFGAELEGRKLGTIGVAGAFSFFPSKTLGGCGDGGMIATDDDDLARMARALRSHGSERKYHNEYLGYNSRLDELQAAVLRIKLREIDRRNESRRRVASTYLEFLADVPDVSLPPGPGRDMVYHQFTIRVPAQRRDALRRALDAAGIASMIYYPVPLHHLPVYASLGVDLANTERAAQEVVSLPIWPSMPRDAIERTTAVIRKELGG